VQVIPEFDMPGHAHAAIAAMKARYHVTNDTTYLLSDPDDTSRYRLITQLRTVPVDLPDL